MINENTFANDVFTGLSQNPKYLSSHYFYDKIGDALFQQIMEMPEYYLTNSELEIFQTQSQAIIDALRIKNEEEFELIELGAGDGKKTQHLLKNLLDNDYRFTYIPVDISNNSLGVITERLKKILPNLNISPQQGEYFEVLDDLFASDKPKIILFIGSNLGNLEDDLATQFLRRIAQHLKKGEKLLLGLDLIKKADIVLPAYDDEAGITSRFNLNLLRRINNELGGDFNLDEFEHAPEYTEESGVAKSYLRSKINQKVYIKAIDEVFQFEAGEKIHTEISRKYSDHVLEKLLKDSDLVIERQFVDDRKYFADYILTKSKK